MQNFAKEIKEYFNALDYLEEPKEKLSFLARVVADKFYVLYLGRRGDFLEYKFQKFCKEFKEANVEFEFLLKDKKLLNFKNEIGYLI